jgi:RNA polymerase-interacting CarD/CdnL/TRCF family regulator
METDFLTQRLQEEIRSGDPAVAAERLHKLLRNRREPTNTPSEKDCVQIIYLTGRKRPQIASAATVR